MPQCDLFPLNQPPVINYNIKLLKEYYTRHQYNYFKNIVQTHLAPIQAKNPRFIPPPTIISYNKITVLEYNPEKDIATIESTIHIQNKLTHVYEDTGRYFITIPITRLK